MKKWLNIAFVGGAVAMVTTTSKFGGQDDQALCVNYICAQYDWDIKFSYGVTADDHWLPFIIFIWPQFNAKYCDP